MNLYAYVGGDPVNGTDPSGLSKISNTIKKPIDNPNGIRPDVTDIIVVTGKRHQFNGSSGFFLNWTATVITDNDSFGEAVKAGSLATVGLGKGKGRKRGEDEDNVEFQICKSALSNITQRRDYGSDDRIFGSLLYRNVFGGARYGNVEVIAIQQNPATQDIVVIAPNLQNCEGTQNYQELQVCGRERGFPFITDPGFIFSFGNSGLPLVKTLQTPFALLVSSPTLPKADAWAKALGISSDRILQNENCEALL